MKSPLQVRRESLAQCGGGTKHGFRYRYVLWHCYRDIIVVSTVDSLYVAATVAPTVLWATALLIVTQVNKKNNCRLEHWPFRKTCPKSKNHIYSARFNTVFALSCFKALKFIILGIFSDWSPNNETMRNLKCITDLCYAFEKPLTRVFRGMLHFVIQALNFVHK